MQIELSCPNCFHHFTAPAQAGDEEALQHLVSDGPFYALGDGETFEDMIYAALAGRPQVRCPRCGQATQVSEESLGEMALSMLTHM